MADVVKDLGVWHEYSPETMPDIPGIPYDTAFPPGMRFCQGPNGDDWYVFRAGWPADTLCVLAMPVSADPNAICTLQSVVWDARLSAVPFGFRVLQITGHDPADLTPWKDWQFKTYDPSTGIIAAADTNVQVVSAVQAEIQLSRMKMPDGKTSVLDGLLAILPGAGIETNLWYKRAATWHIDDANVQKLGVALGLTSADMQGAFNAASEIGV